MALHPLIYQDTPYPQSSGAPQSHALGNTYLPLPFATECACPTSRRISLQLLQDRARTDLKDHSFVMMERSSSSPSRVSLGLVKRSVPGMKSLLPLKLLSPTLPEFGIWSSPDTAKRSTFGTRIVSQDLDQSSDIGDRARDSLKSRKRSQQYRDTPIYSQPGSPIPSRAYFSDDDMSFNCSLPGSICDADRVIQDFANLKEDEAESVGDEMEDEDDECQEDDAQRTPCTVRNIAQRPSAMHTPRWSELSFQCSGEAQYSNESVWLRSPIDKSNLVNNNMLDEKHDDLPERTVESWLSDTSSSFEHEEEVLACATALSPSRAQVIDLSTNARHPSDLSLRIPARSSSLMGTSIPGNNFWDTYGTPPITPSGPWGGESDMLSHLSQVNNDIIVLPKHRLDFSVPSPPLSPHRSPSVVARAANQSPKKRAAMRLSIHDLDGQWPLPSLHPSQPSLTDIISSLEASVSSFPSTILLPDTPCICAIRSREVHQISPPVMPQYHTSASPLRSPFGQEFPRPPSYQPTSKSKTSKFPTQCQESSFSTTSNSPLYMRSSSLPAMMPPSFASPPDLTPLTRIFPKTSDFMRSILYAHIIAHTFITSLSAPMQRSQTACSPGRRRDIPHLTSSSLSPKAANVLGIAFQDSDPTGDSAEKQLQFRIRLQALQQTLRKCIYSLTSVMDSDLGIEDVPELDDNGLGCSNGKLFIRTLEEVVRGCETGLYGTGGMV